MTSKSLKLIPSIILLALIIVVGSGLPVQAIGGKLPAVWAEGTVEEVQEAIAKGAKVNTEAASFTPLMAAASDTTNGLGKVKILLAAGADPNAKGPGNSTALLEAITKNNYSVALHLLKAGVEPNTVTDTGQTALIAAITTPRPITIFAKDDDADARLNSMELATPRLHVQVVELLLESQPKTEAGFISSQPLFAAVTSSTASMVMSVLGPDGKWSDVNAINDEGLTPLMAAVLSEKTDPFTIPMLIQLPEADVHRATKDGKTVFDLVADSPSPHVGLIKKNLLSSWLVRSSLWGTVEEMQKAIDAGADVSSSDPFLDFIGLSTPLSQAINGRVNVLEKVEILLAAGADPNVISKHNLGSALSLAVSNGDLEVVRLLLLAGANVNEATGSSRFQTALGEAALKRYQVTAKDQEQIMKLLIESGAVSRPFESVMGPLCIAVATGASPKVISMLLGVGSKVNDSGLPGGKGDGRTILMCSAVGSMVDPESVKFLLTAGADWNARNKKGETVFDLLDKADVEDPARREVIRKIILAAKLTSLCADGSAKEVGEAIAQGADVNLPNAIQTPLMATATDLEQGLIKAELLLAAGADPNGHNGDRMTPLQVAAARDNVEMVRLLIGKGAEVNAVDSLGRTALWEALHQGRIKCHDDIKDKDKQCPSLKLQEQVVDLLLKAGAVSQPTPEALKAL